MRIFITTLITFWSIWINTSAQDTNVITVIKSKILEQIAREAERKKIIDITVKHVVDGEQHVGIGVLHRPVMKSEGSVSAILHYNQTEVYRIIAGAGTLVINESMTNIKPLDPEGFTVKNLVGPSDFGEIIDIKQSQCSKKCDIVIIPAGIAHGFSEITEAIDYMVVRIDPNKLVTLK